MMIREIGLYFSFTMRFNMRNFSEYDIYNLYVILCHYNVVFTKGKHVRKNSNYSIPLTLPFPEVTRDKGSEKLQQR
jgi:hypothetical protein